MLPITLIASLLAFRFWLRFLSHKLKSPRWQLDLADAPTQEAELIGFFLPRPARRIFNLLVVVAAALILGLPHWAMIVDVWGEPHTSATDVLYYAATLAWWLLLIGMPAMVITRHRKAVAHMKWRVSQPAKAAAPAAPRSSSR